MAFLFFFLFLLRIPPPPPCSTISIPSHSQIHSEGCCCLVVGPLPLLLSSLLFSLPIFLFFPMAVDEHWIGMGAEQQQQQQKFATINNSNSGGWRGNSFAFSSVLIFPSSFLLPHFKNHHFMQTVPPKNPPY